MKQSKSDITLELCFHSQTPDALLVSDDGEEENARWIPRSLVSFKLIDYEPTSGDAVRLVVPKWLARDRGFI